MRFQILTPRPVLVAGLLLLSVLWTAPVLRAKGQAHDEGGPTALMLAAGSGDVERVNALLKARAPVGARDADGATALFYAVRSGRLPVVQALLAKRADPNARQPETPGRLESGYTPLLLAIAEKQKSAELAQRLAAASQGGRGEQPVDPHAFLVASSQYVAGDWTGLITALLVRGADPNRQDGDGNTSLSLALSAGDRELADLLRQHGAKDDLVYRALAPAEALSLAAKSCDVERARRLLAAGADPNAEALHGQAFTNALGCAGTELVRLLLDQGFVPSRVDIYGGNALVRAAAAGRSDLVQLLLDRKVDANSVQLGASWDRENPLRRRGAYDSALIFAVDSKSAESVRLLLVAGADPNHRGIHGATALLHAVTQSDREMVRLLLAAGADPSAADADRRTPLQEAEARARRGGDAGILGLLHQAIAAKTGSAPSGSP